MAVAFSLTVRIQRIALAKGCSWRRVVGRVGLVDVLDFCYGRQFANGRQFAAWCGLVPKQHSSGGKTVLQGITKNGNRELRTLLIHGARAVARFADKRDDHLGQWLRSVIARRGKHKAVVALANKLARIAWKVVHSDSRFDASKACRGQPA